MTSKSLFFDLQKEDLKRRIWSLALYSLFFFLSLTIVIALKLSDNDGSYQAYFISSLHRLIGLNFSITSGFTIVLAIISGLSSFFYLHSKKKTDFYHSLPIRRELQFAINFINGILVYIVPYMVNMVICYILLAVNGYLTGSLFLGSLGAIAINLLYYILIYIIVAIAAILTGNIVVAFLGSGVFLSYGLIMIGIREVIISDYYITFSHYNSMHPVIRLLAPLYNYVEVFNEGVIWLSALKALLAIILLLGLALFFFVKRPSEAAGKAMAFNISKPIIKIGFIAPLSIIGGTLFGAFSNGGQLGWKIFGIFFVGIIGSIIFEIIYHFDIKAAFLRKKEMLVSLVIALAFGAIFELGLVAPDERIPRYDKTTNISISLDNLDRNINYYPVMIMNPGYSDNYRASGDYQLEEMKLTDTKLLYEFAELGVHYVRDFYSDNMVSFTLKFTMNNGSESYRKFRVPRKKIYDKIEKLYAMPEYKEVHFPVLTLDVNEIDGMEIVHPVTYNRYTLSKNQIPSLLNALKSDLRNVALEDVRTNEVVTQVQITIDNQRSEYYIYESFSNTLNFLDSIAYKDTFSLDNVEYIQKAELYYTNYYDDEKYGNGYSNQITLLTADQVKDLKEHLIVSDYFYHNYSIHETLNEYNLDVYYLDPQQGSYTVRYTIRDSGEAKVKQLVNNK